MAIHYEFAKRLKDIIDELIVEPPPDDDNDPVIPINTQNVKVRHSSVSLQNPNRPYNVNDDAEDQLEAEMFFGYGTGFQNDEFNPGTEFRGETLTVLVNIQFRGLLKEPPPDPDNPDPDDKYPLELRERLFLSAARFHDKMQEVTNALRMSPDSEDYGIDDTRLSVQPYANDSPSDVEFLQFAIEIDWYYIPGIDIDFGMLYKTYLESKGYTVTEPE